QLEQRAKNETNTTRVSELETQAKRQRTIERRAVELMEFADMALQSAKEQLSAAKDKLRSLDAVREQADSAKQLDAMIGINDVSNLQKSIDDLLVSAEGQTRAASAHAEEAMSNLSVASGRSQ